MAATDSTRCSGCGAELSAAARFCSICGKDRYAAPPASAAAANTTVRGPAAAVSHRTGSYPPAAGTTSMPSYTSPLPPIGGATQNDKKKIVTAFVAGGFLLLVAGLFFANAAGLLNANKTVAPTTGVLNAPPTQIAPAPILNVPPTTAPPASPILTPPATAGNPMPEDVIAYLRWLKKFEAARRDLSNRSAAVAATAFVKMQKGALDKALDMSEPDMETPKARPENNFLPDLNQQTQQWNQAAGLFQQRVPPNPCAPLALAYNKALNVSIAKTIKLLNLIATIPEKAESDPSSLMQMLTELQTERGTRSISGEIDGTYDSANVVLDSLRDRYTDIPSDISRGQFDVKEESRGAVPSPVLPGFG